jgi:hypothetical protein
MFWAGMVAGVLITLTVEAFLIFLPKIKSWYSTLKFIQQHHKDIMDEKNPCPVCGFSLDSSPFILYEGQKPVYFDKQFMTYRCKNDKCDWYKAHRKWRGLV